MTNGTFPKKLLSMVTDSGCPCGYVNYVSENAFQSAKRKVAPQRAIHGSVPVERASHLSAGLYHTEIAEIEVAQVLGVSQPPTWPWVVFYLSRKNGETPKMIQTLN